MFEERASAFLSMQMTVRNTEVRRERAFLGKW